MSALQNASPCAVPQSLVRIFQPSDATQPAEVTAHVTPVAPVDPWAEDDDAASMTVDEYFVAKMQTRTEATADDYRRALRRWRSFCAAHPILPTLPHRLENDGIRYPVLRSIGSRSLLGFQTWLVANAIPNRETNKNVGAVRAVLSHAAAAGAIASAPKIKPLPTTKAKIIYTLDHREFSRVYHACDVAQWPRSRRVDDARPGRWPLPYEPATGWRALLVLLATYGMRTEDAAAYSRHAKPLRWSNIYRQATNPHPAGKLSNPWGWLVYTPTKTQASKPDPLVLPLTPLVRWHLDQLDPHRTAKPDDLLFDWPLTSGNASKRTPGYYNTFARIFDAADVHPRDWSGKPIDYKPSHLRKTCVTWHENNVSGASGFITGHASDCSPDAPLTAVQRQHYYNPEARLMAALMSCPILGGFGCQYSPT